MHPKLASGSVVAGRYRLERCVGESTTARVWAARHLETGEVVAVKTANEGPAAAQVHRRFRREAQVAALVRHPGILHVRELVELDDGSPAPVMELLEGESLAARLRETAVLPLAELSDILLQAVSAVRAAHERGLVHRDLTPASIFLARGEGARSVVKVRGFGLAERIRAGPGDALAPMPPAEPLGAPSYVSPEQIEGVEDIDHRADVWALGLIAYQCLSGILPTAGPSAGQVVEYILARPIWPLKETFPDAPDDLAAVIDRMLARDRDRRLSDLGELQQVLARCSNTAESTGRAGEPSPAGAPDDHGGIVTGTEETVDLGQITPPLPLEETAGPAPGAAALRPGTVFASRYRVVRLLATGGMGAVYEVIHTETGRRRALKVMHPHILGDREARERFAREAKVAAHIESEWIVDVLDAGVDDGTDMPFLVMELLRGEELDERLARLGRFPPAEAVAHLRDVALALETAHRASIVHRDIKPKNLFLCSSPRGEGRVKILDFGIAKLIADGGASAGTTQSLGTPLYMAPEQFRTDVRLTPAVDVFALGMVAYTVLVGAPYWGEEAKDGNLFAMVATAMRGPSEPATARARRRGVELPAAFDAWFARMTHRDPQRRPRSPVAAIAELQSVLGVPAAPEDGPAQRPSGAMEYKLYTASMRAEPAASGGARRGARAALAAVTVLCIGVGAALWARSRTGPERASHDAGTVDSAGPAASSARSMIIPPSPAPDSGAATAPGASIAAVPSGAATPASPPRARPRPPASSAAGSPSLPPSGPVFPPVSASSSGAPAPPDVAPPPVSASPSSAAQPSAGPSAPAKPPAPALIEHPIYGRE